MKSKAPMVVGITGALVSGGLVGTAPAAEATTATVAGSAKILAAPQTTVTPKSIDPATFEERLRQFEASSIPRTTTGTGTQRVVTYHFKHGLNLSLPHSQPRTRPTKNGSRIAISGGKNRYGVWIGFNQKDQLILKSAILTTGLGMAICAIPGVGWAACGVAGLAISVAAGYVINHGVCSNRRTLYWYSVRGGSTVRCLSSAPQ